MSAQTCVNVVTTPLNVEAAVQFVLDPAHGALDVFIGSVRNHNLGQPVKGVTYDAFDALCENVFREIVAECREQWGEGLNIYVEHFKGYLDVTRISIVIAVSSAHRSESFEACRYLIEQIKQRAPVWKQEHYIDGASTWVEGHALSDKDKAR